MRIDVCTMSHDWHCVLLTAVRHTPCRVTGSLRSRSSTTALRPARSNTSSSCVLRIEAEIHCLADGTVVPHRRRHAFEQVAEPSLQSKSSLPSVNSRQTDVYSSQIFTQQSPTKTRTKNFLSVFTDNKR